MASNADGSIVIDTQLDNSGFEKGSDRLIKALEGIENSINAISDTLSDGLNSVIKSLQAMSSQAASANQQVTRSVDATGQEITQTAEKAENATQAMTGTPQKAIAGYSSLERTVKSLGDQIQRLATTAEIGFRSDGQIMRFGDSVDIVTRKVTELREQIMQIGAARIPTKQYENLQANINKAELALERLHTRQKRLDATGAKTSSASYKRLQYDIDNTDKSLQRMYEQMERMESSGKAFTLGVDTAEYQSLSEMLDTIESKLADVQQAGADAAKSFEEMQEAGDGAARSLESINMVNPLLQTFAASLNRAANSMITIGALTSYVKGIGSAFKKAGISIKNAASRLFNFKGVAQSCLSPIDKLASKLTSLKTLLASRIKRTFISSILSGLSEAMKAYASYSDTFNTAMSNITNALSQIAGNIAAGAATLLTAVEPVFS